MSLFSFAQLQQRLFAWGMAQANGADERSLPLHGCQLPTTLADWKQRHLGALRGTVLEIGPGAGASLRYYAPEITWIGIEPNPYMHPYVKQEADRWGLQNAQIYTGSAEQLPITTASVDAVVSTHVLCSVNHLPQVLSEVQRVLKPDGQFVFLEHVAAEASTWTRRLQEGITPVWKRLFDNCHPQRQTERFLEAAGFQRVNYERCHLAFPVVGPHIVGVAHK